MANDRELFLDAVSPLLNDATLAAVREHVQAMEAMRGSAEDRRATTGLRLLLDNHDKRKRLWKEGQGIKS